jgi:UDP-glucose 4-epimerase
VKRILVTGNAGLIGANLCDFLAAKFKYKLTGIDNLSGGQKKNISFGITFYKKDVCNTRAINSIFQYEEPDVVIHCAAQPAPGLAPFIRHKTFETNVLGHASLINASITNDVKKFIFMSSMDVFGDNTAPFTENMIPRPTNSYGISKYACELDLKVAYEEFGLPYTIIRPHQIFGKCQNLNDPYRNVICIWIRNIIHGDQKINVYGDGNQKRAFSSVKYIMDPIENIINNSGLSNEIYNLGADTPSKIIDVAKLTQKIANKRYGYNSTIIHLEPRREEKYMWCDHTKAKQNLGFRDETDLEELIIELFEYAFTEPKRPLQKIEPEITKNLPSYWK